MNKATRRNLSIFQISVLVIAMALTVVGCFIIIQHSFMIGFLYVVGGFGWLLVYVLTNQKIRKKVFFNLFDEE